MIIPFEQAKEQARRFFSERNLVTKLRPDCGKTGVGEYDYSIEVNDLVLFVLNDLYYVVENFNPEEDKYMPEQAKRDFFNGKILGQALYGTYKTLGRALLSLTQGCYKDGRRPVTWI